MQNILKHLRMHAFEPGPLLLERRQRILLLGVADGALFLLVSGLAFIERPVVQMATHRKLILQVRVLSFGRIHAVFIGFTKDRHGSSVLQIASFVT